MGEGLPIRLFSPRKVYLPTVSILPFFELEDLILSPEVLRLGTRFEMRKPFERPSCAPFSSLLEVDRGFTSPLTCSFSIGNYAGKDPIFLFKSTGPLLFLAWSCFMIIIGLLFIFIQLTSLLFMRLLESCRRNIKYYQFLE